MEDHHGRCYSNIIVYYEDLTKSRTVASLVAMYKIRRSNAEVQTKELFQMFSKLKPGGIGVDCALDSPAVHFGVKGGTVTRLGLQETSVKCTAHRTNLTLGHVRNLMSLLDQAVEFLGDLARDMHNSWLRKEMYLEAQEMLCEKKLQLLDWVASRWKFVVKVGARYLSRVLL